MFKFLSVFNDEQVSGIFQDDNYIGFGKACLIALVAVLIVFLVLCLIIGSIKLLQICVAAIEKKKASKAPAVSEEKPQTVENKNEGVVDATTIEDDDMMAAVLVATIDYAEENAKNGIKKDIKLKSVKRIG